MTETTKNTGEKLSVTPTKTLTLKRGGVEQGVVRQSFSHGRSKAVVVEKVKRRVATPAETKPAETAAAQDRAAALKRLTPAKAPPAVEPAPSVVPAAAKPGVILRTLTEEERSARAHALADARVREAEERKVAEEEARVRQGREEIERTERAAAEARKREEEKRREHDEATKRKADEVAKKRFGAELTLAKPSLARVNVEEEEEAPRPRRGLGGAGPRPAPAPKPQRTTAEKRTRGRLTVVTAFSADEVRERSTAAFHRRERRRSGQRDAEPKEKITREVTIPETITIQELANRMSERSVDVVRLLMKQGHMATSTDTIDADTAQLIAEELGHTVRRVSEADVEEGMFDVVDEPENLQPRAPVVTIMGHVDHGKTSLLDAIRSTEVAAGEAGGITQRIGAYTVENGDRKVTFIDTPGHAAFTAMRARGAKITDIVVLVVAADDGVMPQTVEAISHAKAAGVPIIVAINKIDKPDAKPERVRNELLQYAIQVESLGGEVLEVEVSATKKINLDRLLEAVTLQAEVLDLKADPNRSGEGAVIEARLDRGRGPVATVLVQRGTLRPGDIVIAGSEWGRIRTLLDDKGETLVSAGPSTPVEVLGFSGAPDAGDRVAVVENEARAREITAYRTRQKREKSVARQAGARGSLAEMMQDLKTGAGRKEFPLVVKADVQGSVEAIVGALEKLGNEEVGARVIHSGVGGITESDVILANASGAAVIGFNVRAHKEAREAAEQAGIEIRYYSIIYNLVDDVKDAMSGLLAPTMRETMLGNAQILEIFNVSKVGKIAGCRVTDGVVQKGANVRLIRDNVVIHEGRLETLKRFKDDVTEVRAGQECGMSFENYQDMRQGDVIECYRVEEVKRTL